MKKFVSLFIFLLLCTASGQEKIKVLVNDFSPLVIVENGKYKGFDIDLWEEIANRNKFEYEFVQKDFSEIIPMVSQSKNNVALGGITITSEREKLVDFSHQYMVSDLSVLVNSEQDSFSYITAFFVKMLPTMSLLAIFIVVCGHLLWFSEKGRDAINDQYIPGIFEGMWLSVTTMTTVGYGDYKGFTNNEYLF